MDATCDINIPSAICKVIISKADYGFSGKYIFQYFHVVNSQFFTTNSTVQLNVVGKFYFCCFCVSWTLAESRYFLLDSLVVPWVDWTSPEKKNCNPPCWRYQWKIPEGRVKVVGIPGGYTKIEEKTWISRGISIQKNGKFQGGHSKFDFSEKSIFASLSVSLFGCSLVVIVLLLYRSDRTAFPYQTKKWWWIKVNSFKLTKILSGE